MTSDRLASGPSGEPEPDAIERASLARDAALLRRARWRLVAWGGGMTLVILVALGAAFYTAVQRQLESASVARLEARVAQVIPDGPTDLDDMPPLQLVMGGASSGTFAYLVASDGYVFRPPFSGPAGLPDSASVAAARDEGRDVREVDVDDVPFRVLSLPLTGSVVSASRGRVDIGAIQVVEDRVAEQGTLELILEVLVAGGLLAVLVSLIAGALYSNRALGPIRDSLAAQRHALRRQRDFAADASHELRTPLTIIRTSVEDLRLHADQPVGAVGHALGDIETEVTHVTSLVDDLLLLARSESGALDLTFEPLELGDVAAEAAAAMSVPAARRGVTIAVDPEPVMVSGDRVRLRQLVTILTDNGIRHSPAGAVVTLRVRGEDSEAALVVEDQGRGIRPEDLPHVFDRFWRGREQQRDGAGLGLAIAENIVRRHGGRLLVSNRSEGGARFTARLPQLPGPRSGAIATPDASPRSEVEVPDRR
jgi:two-component system, OmpR family, sensor histidine kinase CiaH